MRDEVLLMGRVILVVLMLALGSGVEGAGFREDIMSWSLLGGESRLSRVFGVLRKHLEGNTEVVAGAVNENELFDRRDGVLSMQRPNARLSRSRGVFVYSLTLTKDFHANY